jgi:hypothetical protein
MNEIVNSIGGKSVVFIRYNPDSVRHNGKLITIQPADRIDLLVDIIQKELLSNYTKFTIKLVQLWFNFNYVEKYQQIQELDITNSIAI